MIAEAFLGKAYASCLYVAYPKMDPLGSTHCALILVITENNQGISKLVGIIFLAPPIHSPAVAESWRLAVRILLLICATHSLNILTRRR